MRLISAGTALVLILGMVGCGTTSTSKGASLGALVGGLSNGIGGAAVGALVGGGVGYLADSADDKKVAQQQAERRTQALERSSISNNPQTTYRPVTTNRLLGTTWRLISIVADDEERGKWNMTFGCTKMLSGRLRRRLSEASLHRITSVETPRWGVFGAMENNHHTRVRVSLTHL